jgi:hypothetical protein
VGIGIKTGKQIWYDIDLRRGRSMEDEDQVRRYIEEL